MIVSVQGADGGVLSDSSDRAEIVFDLGSISGTDPMLEPDDSVTLTIMTASGGTTFVEKRAPKHC